jgi:hypothetical protein
LRTVSSATRCLMRAAVPFALQLHPTSAAVRKIIDGAQRIASERCMRAVDTVHVLGAMMVRRMPRCLAGCALRALLRSGPRGTFASLLGSGRRNEKGTCSVGILRFSPALVSAFAYASSVATADRRNRITTLDLLEGCLACSSIKSRRVLQADGLTPEALSAFRRQAAAPEP